MTIAEKILIILGGSGTAFTTGRFLLRELQKGKNSKPAAELVSLINYWKKEAEINQKKYLKLVDENTTLKIDRVLLHSMREINPMAMWEKDLAGRLVWCSEGYENIFLKPFGKTRLDYIGKNDEEFWVIVLGDKGHEIGQEHERRRLGILGTKEDWAGIEEFSMPSGEVKSYLIYKSPVIVGTELLGTKGLALPINIERLYNEYTSRRK